MTAAQLNARQQAKKRVDKTTQQIVDALKKERVADDAREKRLSRHPVYRVWSRVRDSVAV